MNTIEQIAEKLAKSLGHTIKCNDKRGPCLCGHGQVQAAALDEYLRWKQVNNKSK